MSLTSLTVNQILDAFASSAPTPGGGSAAALSGAVGAALLAMVASMPKTKTGTDEERKTLDKSAAELQRLRKRLTDLIDLDTKAYDMVTSAYRQPKGTPEEVVQTARELGIQYFFIEDESSRASFQIPSSVAYLKSLAYQTRK